MQVEIVEATENPEELICKAARNDYLKEWVGDISFEEAMGAVDGETIEDKKKNLIEKTLHRGHFGIFEHPQITFSVKGVSRSLMAQLTRHRHVSFDVQSQRYVDFSGVSPGELIVRPPSVDDVNHAGRDPDMPDGFSEGDAEVVEKKRAAVFEESIKTSVESYNKLRDLGMPPEDARYVLPIGSKVNMVFSLNARMLMHVADMRAQGDAQHEIENMTKEVLDMAEEWCPITFEYYNENMIHRKNRLSP